MQNSLKDQISRTKASIMVGKPDLAMGEIDSLFALLEAHPPSPADREQVEEKLAELRGIAVAALTGARSAAEQIQAIIRAAGSLQTYDSRGQVNVATAIASPPRRF